MSRNLSNDVIKDLYTLSPTGVDLLLLRVSYNNQILRFVRNTENIMYNGFEYIALPFTLVLPDEKEEGAVTANLIMADVTGDLFGIVRQYDYLDAEFDLITQSPSGVQTLISTFTDFKLSNVSWDASTISFTLDRDDVTIYSFPKDSMDNTLLPNLY